MTDTNSDTTTTDNSIDATADPLEPNRDLDAAALLDENGAAEDDGPREVVHKVDLDMDHGDIGLFDLQRHRNGDETAILLLSFGKGYQALAIDVDAGGQLLEIEEIGDSPDEGRAVGMIDYWLQQNPDGVLGGEPEEQSFLDKLGFGGGDGA